MYEKAVVTNERLKSRLETSKQDLAVIQEQLQTAQVQTAGILSKPQKIHFCLSRAADPWTTLFFFFTEPEDLWLKLKNAWSRKTGMNLWKYEFIFSVFYHDTYEIIFIGKLEP